MTPLVSIVIPCFNGEAVIARAVESALAQTIEQVEVVVVDDGSSDGSVDILRGFGDRIRWESGPNRGACAARNRGVALARGEWIQFLDADDELLPDKLARQLPQSLAHPGILVTTAGWHDRGDGGFDVHAEDGAGRDPVVFAIERWIQTSAPLHRRTDLLAVGGFREDLPCSQERDLHLRLAIAGLGFRAIGEPLYRKHGAAGSISRNRLRTLRWRRDIFERARQALDVQGGLTGPRRRALARMHVLDAFNLFALGEDAAYRERLALARSLHPSAGADVLCDSRGKRSLLAVAGPSLYLRMVESRARLRRDATQGASWT